MYDDLSQLHQLSRLGGSFTSLMHSHVCFNCASPLRGCGAPRRVLCYDKTTSLVLSAFFFRFTIQIHIFGKMCARVTICDVNQHISKLLGSKVSSMRCPICLLICDLTYNLALHAFFRLVAKPGCKEIGFRHSSLTNNLIS